MKIYISLPLIEGQIEKAIKKSLYNGVLLLKTGHTPIIPFLSHEKEITYDEWINHCLQLLEMCDCLLFLGLSKETSIELKHAINNKIQVYFSVDEIIKPRTFYYNNGYTCSLGA